MPRNSAPKKIKRKEHSKKIAIKLKTDQTALLENTTATPKITIMLTKIKKYTLVVIVL